MTNRFLSNSSLLLAVLLFATSLFAQSTTLHLSLDDALNKAGDNNYEIKMADAQVDAQRADFNKSSAIFLPQIVLSETFLRTNDPLNVFGLKLKQEIVSQMDFNPVLLNNPDEFNNFVTKLEVSQPIINLDGFWGRSAAANALSAMKNKKIRTENYIEFLVKMSYYKMSLMKTSLTVVDQALETARANRKLIRDYYDEGLITKADYLMAEVFVANLESQKSDVQSQLLNSGDNLRLILGIEDDITIEPTDTLAYTVVTETPRFSASLIEKRSDIRAYSKRLTAMDRMHSMSWMKFMPRLNAFGSYEFNDDKAFGTNAKNWMVGLNLRWNIFNGFQNVSAIQKSGAELRHATYELEKAKSQARNEIKAAARDLQTAKKKLALARTVVEQSEESLRIIKDRYAKGLEKTTDLLNAETAASSSRLTYLKTLFFYNVSIFKVELMNEKRTS